MIGNSNFAIILPSPLIGPIQLTSISITRDIQMVILKPKETVFVQITQLKIVKFLPCHLRILR